MRLIDCGVVGVKVIVIGVVLLVRRLDSGQSACGVRLDHLQATDHAAVSRLHALPRKRRGLAGLLPGIVLESIDRLKDQIAVAGVRLVSHRRLLNDGLCMAHLRPHGRRHLDERCCGRHRLLEKFQP